MESFKTYEHALSEDSVMDYFRNIINKVSICCFCITTFAVESLPKCFFFSHCYIQSKKFAKPELKSCVEEFEEKLNRFHMEHKEQEVTARNAQVHQQKVGSLESFMVDRSTVEAREEADTVEGRCISPFLDAICFMILQLLE